MTQAQGGLGPGGRRLWRDVTAEHELDVVQEVLLVEACRMKDRCDLLDKAIRGDGKTFTESVTPRGKIMLTVADADRHAIASADAMKRLLNALRLPDANGKRPQRRGAARGAYRPRRLG